MRVGVLADTHDNLEAVEEAVRILNSRAVDLVIHAGDVISPFSAKRFHALESPMKVAYGNNDGERRGLRSMFSEMGSGIDDFLDFEFGGTRFAVYHGTIGGVLSGLLDGGRHDVVVTGHSHEPLVEPRGKTLLINPGEACGYLTGRRTLVILELDSMEHSLLEF